jgi:hypothetical protein|tara:strand:+ start:268 stop:459 length:192 start_codon:yes stop_codon:yes gene_type:complete
MPIWLRKFTYSEMLSHYEEEKKSHEKASNGGKGAKNLVNPDGKVNTPAFAEASKAYKGKTSYN